MDDVRKQARADRARARRAGAGRQGDRAVAARGRAHRRRGDAQHQRAEQGAQPARAAAATRCAASPSRPRAAVSAAGQHRGRTTPRRSARDTSSLRKLARAVAQVRSRYRRRSHARAERHKQLGGRACLRRVDQRGQRRPRSPRESSPSPARAAAHVRSTHRGARGGACARRADCGRAGRPARRAQLAAAPRAGGCAVRHGRRRLTGACSTRSLRGATTKRASPRWSTRCRLGGPGGDARSLHWPSTTTPPSSPTWRRCSDGGARTTGLPLLVRLTQHVGRQRRGRRHRGARPHRRTRAVDALVSCVEGNNFFRTFPAIDVLGRSGDPRAIAPLVAPAQEPALRLRGRSRARPHR